MKITNYLLLSVLILCFSACTTTQQENSKENKSTQTSSTEKEKNKPDWAIVIHGGAGAFNNGNISQEQYQQYEKAMLEALDVGTAILKENGTSIDAVEQTIQLLENNPLFNAGKGAVLSNIGTAELDASIMNGKDLNAGAVAGVTTVKNPISLARKVMEESPHVMLANQGADKFAQEQQLQQVDNTYFITSKQAQAFKKAKQKQLDKDKMGTVGCVAIDKQGNIVAGTSTGGMFLKKWGRVGDSPIIGAGTYANNNTCGVSATGWGEYFIRAQVAGKISALMEYKNLTLQQACDEMIFTQLPNIDKEKAVGGVIAIDKNGNIVTSYNTFGMLYAFNNSKGDRKFGLFKD